MVRPIIQAPDDRLRRVAEPVPEAPLEEHLQAILDLQDTFNATENCIGLAATQIDHHWRVIVVDTTRRRTDTYLMVNPIITKASTDLQAVNDGCMSVSNGKRRAQTRRPKRHYGGVDRPGRRRQAQAEVHRPVRRGRAPRD